MRSTSRRELVAAAVWDASEKFWETAAARRVRPWEYATTQQQRLFLALADGAMSVLGSDRGR